MYDVSIVKDFGNYLKNLNIKPRALFNFSYVREKQQS